MKKKRSAWMLRKASPRLLIVDDQPVNIYLMCEVFPSNYEIFIAMNGKQALEICEKSLPDLILLDIVMPEMDGLTLCQLFKKQAAMRDIPIIFVTALQSNEEENACWEAGGVDFVTKPINPLTLLNRVNAHLTLKFQNEYLRELTLIDELTDIANRRAFDERIHIDFHHAKRTKTSLGILMIDVDDFKYYNDKYGHQAGDECLFKIATVLRSTLNRATDLIARYGGEEFICLMPDVNQKNALLIAEKIRSDVQKLRIKHAQSTVTPVVTVSIGVVIYPDTPCQSSQDLIEVADKRLYEAKSKGRNQVCSEGL
ncbi:MAG: diguanylate cyclase [Gammaproteobacteria bacterium]|nr:diguanylate cyclase [Gammaproteobacteria bacterium]